MAGMKFKSFPLMGTWLFAASFILSNLWHSVFRDGWGFLISGLLFLSIIIYAFVSLLIVLFDWSRLSCRRFLINAVALGAFIPALALGGFIRVHLFLADLPRFQTMTNLMIQDNATTFPSSYSHLLVSDHVIIDHGQDNNVTVLYFTPDSSAVGHSGFLYRSDDDIQALKGEFPDFGFRRIAPKWYLWGS
jgi:hypothetical protein